jgi:hypothetical protein
MNELSREIERFRIAYQTGLAKHIAPISQLAVAEAEALIAEVLELRASKNATNEPARQP